MHPTLEIKALSRIYSICMLVIPRDPNFGTLTFKEARKAKSLVLWHSPKHFSFVAMVPVLPVKHARLARLNSVKQNGVTS